ncbi:MAG: A24 family peptidase [Planctomycetota bacterium]
MSQQLTLQPAAPVSQTITRTDRAEATGSTAPAAILPAAASVAPLISLRRPLRLIGWSAPLVLAVVSGLVCQLGLTKSWFISWPGMLVVAFALTSAITDTLWRKIPNWLTYPACLAGLAIATIVTIAGPSAWAGTLDLGASLSGLGLCFFCMLLPYRASGGGAADVKLAAVYGTLLGWQAGLSIIIVAYLVAGLSLMVIHLSSNHPWLLPSALMRWLGSAWFPQVVAAPDETQKKLLRRPIPLAGAFAVGLICVLCGANLFGN